MKYLKMYEDYTSGIFEVNLDGEKYIFSLYAKEQIPVQVYIMLDDDIYDELSIIIPDTEKLSKNEFFLNPDIDKRIVKVLENENFIIKTGKKAIAGDKETESYSI